MIGWRLIGVIYMTNDLNYARILAAVNAAPWAIMPEKLAIIRHLLALRANGQKLTDEEIAAAMDVDVAAAAAAADGRQRFGPGGANNVAILPLVGTIIPRLNLLRESSGAVSTQRFAAMFRAAMADPDIDSIIIDVDSPGGQVGGVDELAAEIYSGRGTKPITAVVNTLAASAAYWIATAADEVVITPSGQAGGIGVFAIHEDLSQHLENEGVKITMVAAGRYKTEGNPFEPLTDEARVAMQGTIDAYYEMFIGAVARNRNVSVETVRSGFGEGRVITSGKAVALGMADRVDTLPEVIRQNTMNQRSSGGHFAHHHRQIEIQKLKVKK